MVRQEPHEAFLCSVPLRTLSVHDDTGPRHALLRDIVPLGPSCQCGGNVVRGGSHLSLYDCGE